MKIRKLKSDWNYGIPVMCQAIIALKTARDASTAYHDGNNVSTSGGFQCRCNDAIVALANRLMEEHVERFYEPETKKFLVTYDVKRSGCHEMEVEAKDEAEAKQIVLRRLNDADEAWIDGLDTEIVATDVVEAAEVRDGQA